MKIYLAGGESRHWLFDNNNDMRIYLAGDTPYHRKKETYGETIQEMKPYILESFYTVNSDTVKLIPIYGDFLLDSGAFTFIQNSKVKANWEQYIEKYADFINSNNVKKYFELDIDSIVGYEKVREYRERLKNLTGINPIPVWHINRGKEEFVKMCEEYDYVALGGIVTIQKNKEAYKKYVQSFPWFIKTAHEHGAKIHGLGFTSLDGIKKYHFDSVDSTAWTTGNRFGYAYKFDGRTIIKIERPEGKKIKGRPLAINNFREWIKFQKYAENNL